MAEDKIEEDRPNIFDAPSRLKEKWNNVDELCPTCHQVTRRETGLTRQNMRRLLIGKPTFYDWTFLFIILMTIFMAYRYNLETSQATYMAEHFADTCQQMGYIPQISNHSYTNIIPQINFTQIKSGIINSSDG
jgi:hypothetical protein